MLMRWKLLLHDQVVYTGISHIVTFPAIWTDCVSPYDPCEICITHPGSFQISIG